MANLGIDNVSFIILGDFNWLPEFAHSWIATALSEDSSRLSRIAVMSSLVFDTSKQSLCKISGTCCVLSEFNLRRQTSRLGVPWELLASYACFYD